MLLGCVVVGAIPVGYMWTSVTTRLDNVDYRIKTLSARVDRMEVCQVVEDHALANKDRIEFADERLSEMDTLLKQCAERLRADQSSEAAK